jgi:hypothetical protein
MKLLTAEERGRVVGEYFNPDGLHGYAKSLPFLGSVKSNAQTLTAGEWTEIILTYEVGASGLADGAWIKGTSNFIPYASPSPSAPFTRLTNDRIGRYSKPPIAPKTTLSAQSIRQESYIQAKLQQLSNPWAFDLIRKVMKDHSRKLLSST